MKTEDQRPDEGDLAPDFTLPRDGGGSITLSELRGRPVVVYFYPRDDTPGCTTEAVDFTAALKTWEGVTVLGISKDTVARHDRFRDKHGLGVILLSDAEGDTCERWGTWVEKSMYGKTSMGIERSTFLVDAEGRISKAWRKVRVPGHVDDVGEALAAL